MSASLFVLELARGTGKLYNLVSLLKKRESIQGHFGINLLQEIVEDLPLLPIIIFPPFFLEHRLQWRI